MAETKHDYVADIRKYAPSPVSSLETPRGLASVLPDPWRLREKHPGCEARCQDALRFQRQQPRQPLTESDADLDAALQDIMGKMKGVREKSRVTVCYLLAEKFGKLELFHKG